MNLILALAAAAAARPRGDAGGKGSGAPPVGAGALRPAADRPAGRSAVAAQCLRPRVSQRLRARPPGGKKVFHKLFRILRLIKATIKFNIEIKSL